MYQNHAIVTLTFEFRVKIVAFLVFIFGTYTQQKKKRYYVSLSNTFKPLILK